ncbi:tyrosine-type recombinase/integrase [Sphingosinicella rhizophila]|uniref:Integrase arm-type DNA-binding domain-containing protein n=1 Tax=Sphingosinicella rhizophila TaxID=3050082 RepID=A0ABU3Q5A9_9SPHN|nr:integrase arm-type DNA-binding domain-containing protein [Sphingosinicella sp. GR2756]MDT9598589.1 integrase arm-type DNA-binding domain-containing protein [Sphingosinicella sp. GR2756]
MGKLTPDAIKRLTEPGRYPDGDGLYFRISPSGGKSWMMRVQINGTRRDLGLGELRHVSLRDARLEAAAIKKMAASGIDPLIEKRKAQIVIPTFAEAARRTHAEMIRGWKSGKHTSQWIKTLELYAFPKLGKLKVNEIEGPIIRDVLAEIWLEIPETARRVRQRIGVVLDWSYANGLRSTEAPMRSLSKGLPRQPKKNGHFAALPYAEVPAFMERLRARDLSSSRLALEALILTTVRSGEIRGAKWNELNDDLSVWIIPPDRMKAGVQHAVPLSPQAADVFRQAKMLWGDSSDLIFPGAVSSRPLSDMALLELVRGMDLPATVHGFRSSFRDWAADQTEVPREVAEAALAHVLDNKVEAAYRRTDFFEKRRHLMISWADYCLPARSESQRRASRTRSAAAPVVSSRAHQL